MQPCPGQQVCEPVQAGPGAEPVEQKHTPSTHSLLLSAHDGEQLVCLQLPLTHDSPVAQAFSHELQCRGSLLRSTQPAPGQQVLPIPQAGPSLQLQALRVQDSPGWHLMSQPPQLRASTAVLAQALPQQV